MSVTRKFAESCRGWQRYNLALSRLGAFAPLVIAGVFAGETHAQTASAPAADAQARVRTAFASTLVLTDTKAVSLGILEFDLGSWVEPLSGDEFGSEQSVQQRRSLRTFSFPTRWKFDESSKRWSSYVGAGLNAMEAREDLVSNEGGEQANEQSRDRIYGGFLEGGIRYEFSRHWRFGAGVALHGLRYNNSVDSSLSVTEALNPDVGERFFNTNATAAVGELQSQLVYSSEARGIPWKFRSAYSYYAGETVSTDANLAEVKPETYSWSNGVTVRWPLGEVYGEPNYLRLVARRIDIGGDVVAMLATDKFYEFGVGWLVETGGVSWMDNIGVSVALNTGSALSGGSVRLLYNEEL